MANCENEGVDQETGLERQAATGLDACLTRCATLFPQYKVWLTGFNLEINKEGEWVSRVHLTPVKIINDESAILESLRLPPGGGPVAVRLVIMPQSTKEQ